MTRNGNYYISGDYEIYAGDEEYIVWLVTRVHSNGTFGISTTKILQITHEELNRMTEEYIFQRLTIDEAFSLVLQIWEANK